ncbi:NAD-dependent epimerase/dehydratase family protein [Pedobacter duraquae]|uniref:NAD-dependent epimerase/dehydratase family protein n=1 Tax=Pedobacter duraquae TaxID=425511 RepID=A0A4R6IQ54_9SPHI|nr:NAD-dependent epimerase/dehydratase family protein [Pedobacter duraquae]TDO24311.1 NAD-dependent epimerase/dehydratase family protein [Pedobacter duraquae]
MEIKVIITGASGLVGEGVLLECLQHPQVKEVLMVNRKANAMKHPKLKECIVPDFLNLTAFEDQLKGYDACFYCAGISSNGIKEAEYSRITYDTALYFADRILKLNPAVVYSHISGSHTDSSENGRVMWARVKGKAENALMRLPFRNIYNFRPGLMKPSVGQQNIKGYYKVINWMFPLLKALFPNQSITLHELGKSMINSVLKGYSKQILEVADIKRLARV